MTMQVPHTPPSDLFDLVKRGEKKKSPYLESLRSTQINRQNIAAFIDAMGIVPANWAAEIIASLWGDLDVECRVAITRDWLDRKEKEQQAGGYHALTARLLAIDPESAFAFLDRTIKLSTNSAPCHKRVISTTRLEWLGTTVEESRYRQLDPGVLGRGNRINLLDWLADACRGEPRPGDDERRRNEAQKQSLARTALLVDWLQQLQTSQLPEVVAVGIDRVLNRLRPQPTGAPKPDPVLTIASAAPSVAPQQRDEPPKHQGSRAISALDDDANGTFREVIDAVKRLFRKESEQHRREQNSLETQLRIATTRAERSDHDAAAFRAANSKAAERIRELEEKVKTLDAERATQEAALTEARGNIDAITLKAAEAQRQAHESRTESHEAVSRETQRERERLAAELGQRVANIVEGFREIRSRGPLPEGPSSMIADMMEELISRLEAAGMRFRKE